MTDTVDKATRSRIMSRITGKDTKPELALRKGLHARGFRFRLHARGLPGTPDLVMRRHRVVCFVHGCFWHRHESCASATMPASRTEYWKAKFDRNVERDEQVRRQLLDAGWRVAVVWECALVKGRFESTLGSIEKWIKGNRREFETSVSKPQVSRKKQRSKQ